MVDELSRHSGEKIIGTVVCVSVANSIGQPETGTLEAQLTGLDWREEDKHERLQAVILTLSQCISQQPGQPDGIPIQVTQHAGHETAGPVDIPMLFYGFYEAGLAGQIAHQLIQLRIAHFAQHAIHPHADLQLAA
jgi:hypothetical protein